MPLITYIDTNGNQFEANVEVGSTVMQGAVDNGIDGILAECGGSCACATCHCYVDENWTEIVGPADSMEQDMLEGVVDPKLNSRLSCQIEVTEQLDGLVVRLPASQY